MEEAIINGTKLNVINTVFSIASKINNDRIKQAKEFLAKRYNSTYNTPTPHITYAITPLKESHLTDVQQALTSLVSNMPAFTVQIGGIEVKDNGFVYLPVTGANLLEKHMLFTNLLDKFHTNEIREKDLIRYKNNELSQKDQEFLVRYGYYRIFENFKAHLTIGDIQTPNVDFAIVVKELESILSQEIHSTIKVNNIHAIFHTDALVQTNMKIFWEETYNLN